MYAFGAMLSFTIAHLAVDPAADASSPTTRGPTAGRATSAIARPLDSRCSRSSAGSARRSRSSSSPCCTSTSRSPASAGWRSASSSTRLPPPPGARPDDDHEGRRPAAGRRARGRVRVGARRASTPRSYSPGAVATAARLAARRRRGIHVLVDDHGPAARSPIDAALPEQEHAGAGDHRAGAAAGRPARDRATGRRSAPGQAGRLIVEEAARAARRGRSSCRCRRARAARCSARRSRPCSPERPVPRDHRVRPAPTRRRRRASRRRVAPVDARRRVTSTARPTRIAVGRHGRRSAWRCSCARSPSGGGPLALGVLLGVLFIAAGGRGAPAEPALASLAARARERPQACVLRRGARRAGALRDRLHGGRAASIYFSLGVVADHALGLTPVVFLVARAVLRPHDDDLRRGRVAAPGPRRRRRSSPATRFNELWSFIAGWAILLDYLILIAVTVVLGDELPRRRSGATLGARARRAHPRVRHHRLRRDAQHPRLLARRAATRIAALVIADLGAAAARSSSASRCSSTSTARRLDPPRHGADVERLRSSRWRRDGGVHRAGVRVRARGRGRASAARGLKRLVVQRRVRASCSSTSASRSSRSRALPVVDGTDRLGAAVHRGAGRRGGRGASTALAGATR